MTGPTMKTTCYLILTLMLAPAVPAQGGDAGQPSDKEIRQALKEQAVIRRLPEWSKKLRDLCDPNGSR